MITGHVLLRAARPAFTRHPVRVQALFGGGNKDVRMLDHAIGFVYAFFPYRMHAWYRGAKDRVQKPGAFASPYDDIWPYIVSEYALLLSQGGGGGNPFGGLGNMGNLMESVKKAQQLVQVETQRVQQELDA